jgi:hypothetical protein
LNDPFVIDEFDMDGFDLFPSIQRPQLEVEHAGFMDLVKMTYDDISIQNRYLDQYVPFSIYSYYCTQLLHARLNELEKQFRRPYDVNFDVLMREQSFTVPKIISRYLDSLGEMTSPDGQIYQLAAPRSFPNANGDYGQYDALTSVAYQQCPAPSLTLAQVQADLAQPHVPAWSPQGVLAPVLVPGYAAVPNENLLGYFTSTGTSPRSRPIYARLGFTASSTPPDIVGNYKTSISVMDHVSSYLLQQQRGIRLETVEPGERLGSLTQSVFLEPENVDALPRSAKYSRQSLRASVTFKLHSQVIAAAFIAAHRLKQVPRSNGTLPYLGYSWHATGNPAVEVPPPAEYLPVINTVHSGAQSSRLNSSIFDVTFKNRQQIISAALVQFRETTTGSTTNP